MARRSETRTDVRTVPIIVPGPLVRMLKATRLRYNLTLRAVADVTGVSAATCSRIERQLGEPDVTSLILLSSFVLAMRQGKTQRESAR
jgi:transcriptional regulator with XRE-family HTH domain